MKMFYTKPPNEWMEGLPIGNGRLAAMIWGDATKDIIDLNHEWLWRGNYKDRHNADVSANLPYVRKLLKERDFLKATMAANLFFGGNGGISGIKHRVDPYQTAGYLTFEVKGDPVFEWRELDIDNGICKVSRGGVVSEFFASCENGLIMSKWCSNNKFSCVLSQARVEDKDAVYNFVTRTDKFVFDCSFNGGIKYRSITEIKTDGQCTVNENSVEIADATFVKCITNIATSVFDLEAEIKKYRTDFDNFDADKNKHSAKFAGIMKGVVLEITEDAELNKLSIEKRLARIREGNRDNGLVEMYFNFGRYLMVSSSVAGDLPANLQGKWNEKIDPPWECDYHFDINLQMNYWMVESCNMPECAEALLKYLETFYESGQEAARNLYGCKGIYLPIQTDAWGKSTPEAFGWSVWVGAAAWFTQNFWNRYIYTGDIDYLRNRGYRFLKAVAEFFEDYLVEDDDGVLQVMPSQSPENRFAGSFDNAFPVSIGVSAAMDVQLIYDAFSCAVQAAEILNVDAEQAKLWKSMRDRLPDFKIGEDGRLLEWNEDKKEVEPGHRHLSHLYGVYPSELFTNETRPEQFEAARKSLEYRLSHGGGHTGWSRAWVACLQSRFGNAEAFYAHYTALIRDFATITLLDLHPPRIFQIDGNLGGVAAVVESMISFTDNKVYLLRSLPKEWSEGSLQGIKLPGGHTVSIWWKDGKIADLKIVMGFVESLTVCYDGKETVLTGAPGTIVGKL